MVSSWTPSHRLLFARAAQVAPLRRLRARDAAPAAALAYRAFRAGHGRTAAVLGALTVGGAAVTGRGLVTRRRTIVLAQKVPLVLGGVVAVLEAALVAFLVGVLGLGPVTALSVVLVAVAIAVGATTLRGGPRAAAARVRRWRSHVVAQGVYRDLTRRPRHVGLDVLASTREHANVVDLLDAGAGLVDALDELGLTGVALTDAGPVQRLYERKGFVVVHPAAPDRPAGEHPPRMVLVRRARAGPSSPSLDTDVPQPPGRREGRLAPVVVAARRHRRRHYRPDRDP